MVRGRDPARARSGAGFRGQHRGHREDARQGLDDLLGLFAQRFEAGAPRRFDLDREPDITVAHDDARHHAERDDVGAPVRVAHRPQRVENLFSVIAIAAPATPVHHNPGHRGAFAGRERGCRHLRPADAADNTFGIPRATPEL